MQERQEELKKLKQDIRRKQRNSEGKKKKKLTPNTIRKRIQKYEWKLQTTPATEMSIEDERSIVDNITDLEQKLIKTQRDDSEWSQKRDLQDEIHEYRREMHQAASEMQKYVQESRKKHKKMISAYKEANKIRKEADRIHQNIQEVKSEADEYHQDYIASLKAKRKAKRKMKKKRKEKYVDMSRIPQRQIKEQANEAEDKVKDGKKISFNEFRSLIDQGMI